jgi:hypothetical protein
MIVRPTACDLPFGWRLLARIHHWDERKNGERQHAATSSSVLKLESRYSKSDHQDAESNRNHHQAGPPVTLLIARPLGERRRIRSQLLADLTTLRFAAMFDSCCRARGLRMTSSAS